MQRGTWVLGASGAAIAVAVACSGKTADVGGTSSSSGSSSGGSTSSSSGTLVSRCPASPPSSGSACANAGLECEYGTDVNLQCNTVARCSESRVWQVDVPQTSGCPTPPPGLSCPASYADVKSNDPCSSQGTSCAYPQGTCTCEIYCGPQYPAGRVCDAGTPTTWQCTGTGDPQCPVIRPHLGTACTQEGQMCAYGDCNGPQLKCVASAWKQQMVGCPVSSRRYKKDVSYLDDAALASLADRTMATRLATYQYKEGDPATHLGFIIEDDPTSPAVLQGKDRVDLYGYTSMAVATLQVQGREIASLKRDIENLRRELDAAKRGSRTGRCK